jgi:hypothetical protein
VGDDGFLWRGQNVSRVERFSCAVFAFAITLLTVSLEVPETFDELLAVYPLLTNELLGFGEKVRLSSGIRVDMIEPS